MNAVIYARYSSHSQQETSIEGQLQECYAFCEREGYAVVGEYIDRALTGRNDDRPDFQRMISDASKKQFQTIIVYKLDRFARNRYDSAMYKAKLKKNGVRVVSAMENISDTPEGIILESMLEGLAEYYSANLSQNVKRGQQRSVENGTFTGGRAPIGYRVENKKLIVDEKTSPIIRYAFEQYAAGVPKKQIVNELNAQGIRNSAGNLLTAASFQVALRSTKYKGTYMYGGREVAGGCPAIVDTATWDKVQERLDGARKRGAVANAKVEYLLAGKAYCGHCGASMVAENGRGKMGNKYYYYACATKKKLHTCGKKNEKKDFIEWYVVEQTVEYVLTPSRIEEIARRVVAAYDDEFNDNNIAKLEGRINALERDITKLVNSIINAPEKVVPKITQQIDLLETQRLDLSLDLSRLRIANGIRYTQKEVQAWLSVFCRGDLMDPEFRRRIIDTFINSIFLFDDHVVIYYNIKEGKQISYFEMLDSTEELHDDECLSDSGGGSIIKGIAPPKSLNVEPPYFIFVNGLFGCVFKR